MPNLTIYDGEGTPSQFLISLNEPVTIGRSDDCDIVIDSQSISGTHAVFEPVGHSYQLRDLGSTNGIEKEGVRSDKIELSKDSDVVLGTIPIRVSFSEEELAVIQSQPQFRPQVQPQVVMPTPQIAKKSKGSNFIVVLVLLALGGGAFYLNQEGYFKAFQIKELTNGGEASEKEDSANAVTKGSQSLRESGESNDKTELAEQDEMEGSEELAVAIDPASPPKRLRVRLEKGGEDRTFVLDKMQTRRADYEFIFIDSGGSTKKLKPGIERNYSGYCEEEPDSLVTAYVHSDGSLTANVFKAQQIKGTGAHTDWDVQTIDDYSLLTEDALQPSGKPLEGATWVDSNSREHPLYNDNYTYDIGFEYQSAYVKDYSDLSPKGFEMMQYRADYSNAMFSLVSTRDLLVESKVAKVVVRESDPNWGEVYQDWVRRFGDAPIDTVAMLTGGGSGGSYGFSRGPNHRRSFKVSKNGGSLPWLVFRHETGHYLGVGDMAGGAREGATIVNGNQFSRWGAPALQAVIETDRAKHIVTGEDKNMMVSIGNAKIQVPPYAYADQAYISEGGRYIFDVLANDFDANGQQLALAGFEKTSASGGAVRWNVAKADGRDSLEYKAPPNFTGVDRFSYSIVDKTGRVAHGNVLIYISKPGLQAYWGFENISNKTEIPSKGIGKVVAKQAKEKPQFSWNQTEIEDTQEWDVSKVLNKPGAYNVTLTYRGGDSAFLIEGCALELNGKVISRDMHEGAAGHAHVTKENVYRLKLKKGLKPTDKLVLKAKTKLGKNRANLSSDGLVLIEPLSRSKKKVGKKGQGLELDGKKSLGLPTWRLNSKSITIAAWVKSESWKGGTWGPRIIQMAGRGQAWRLNAEHGKMAFCLGDPATKKWNNEGLLLTELPPENKWVHIAAVSDGLSMKIYYDGKLVAEKERVGPVEDAASGGVIGSKFKGVIDELYVFNKPLSRSEIRKLMRSR